MTELQLVLPDDNDTEITVLIWGYDKNAKRKKVYIPLILALIDRLTKKQLINIISNAHLYRDGIKRILDKDITNCFELSSNMNFSTMLRVDHNNTDHHCICGVRIENKYYIVNPEDIIGGALTEYRIGCECIKNWNEEEFDKILFEKRKKEFSEVEFCKICKHKIDKKSCSCKKKYNVTLKLCFNSLRSISENSGSNKYLEFGKFADMTYLQLIKSENKKHKEYIRWILSDSFTSPAKNPVKENLQKFIQNRNNYKNEL